MADQNAIDISVIVPVYGSQEILPELYSQLEQVMRQHRWSFEVLFVCDNSPDRSWNVIKDLAERFRSARGILLRVNAGQHNALMAGLRKARGEFVVTMDDDLQHSPSDIPAMIHALQNGADAVYAKFRERRHPLWKRLGSSLNNAVASYLIRKPRDLYLSPFRAFRAKLSADIARYDGPYVYFDGLLLSATRNIETVIVEHHDRYAGESRYGLKKSISLWLKMATSFSIIPLRVTSLLGIFFSLLGFLLAIIFIIQKFTTDSMPTGWTSLIVTILIVGGVQLLSLGMIGEYLGRTLLTINGRPQFVISEETQIKDN